MKFKEKRGNTFVFDGGYDLDELELEYLGDQMFNFKGFISVSVEMEVVVCGVAHYKDIQTAVNLMQILINEGEV